MVILLKSSNDGSYGSVAKQILVFSDLSCDLLLETVVGFAKISFIVADEWNIFNLLGTKGAFIVSNIG